MALTHSSFIDVQVALTYSIGVQDALASGRFLYVRPALGKSISVHRRATLDIALGVGFKVYNHPDENPDRDIDVGFDVELPLALTSTFFVKPGVHVAWTNLDGASVGDETMVWGNVIVGVKL